MGGNLCSIYQNLSEKKVIASSFLTLGLFVIFAISYFYSNQNKFVRFQGNIVDKMGLMMMFGWTGKCRILV